MKIFRRVLVLKSSRPSSLKSPNIPNLPTSSKSLTAESIFEKIGQTQYQSKVINLPKPDAISLKIKPALISNHPSRIPKDFSKPKTDFKNLPPVEYTDRSKNIFHKLQYIYLEFVL